VHELAETIARDPTSPEYGNAWAELVSRDTVWAFDLLHAAPVPDGKLQPDSLARLLVATVASNFAGSDAARVRLVGLWKKASKMPGVPVAFFDRLNRHCGTQNSGIVWHTLTPAGLKLLEDTIAPDIAGRTDLHALWTRATGKPVPGVELLTPAQVFERLRTLANDPGQLAGPRFRMSVDQLFELGRLDPPLARKVDTFAAGLLTSFAEASAASAWSPGLGDPTLGHRLMLVESLLRANPSEAMRCAEALETLAVAAVAGRARELPPPAKRPAADDFVMAELMRERTSLESICRIAAHRGTKRPGTSCGARYEKLERPFDLFIASLRSRDGDPDAKSYLVNAVETILLEAAARTDRSSNARHADVAMLRCISRDGFFWHWVLDKLPRPARRLCESYSKTITQYDEQDSKPPKEAQVADAIEAYKRRELTGRAFLEKLAVLDVLDVPEAYDAYLKYPRDAKSVSKRAVCGIIGHYGTARDTPFLIECWTGGYRPDREAVVAAAEKQGLAKVFDALVEKYPRLRQSTDRRLIAHLASRLATHDHLPLLLELLGSETHEAVLEFLSLAVLRLCRERPATALPLVAQALASRPYDSGWFHLSRVLAAVRPALDIRLAHPATADDSKTRIDEAVALILRHAGGE
jgi:hypothetical protein